MYASILESSEQEEDGEGVETAEELWNSCLRIESTEVSQSHTDITQSVK